MARIIGAKGRVPHVARLGTAVVVAFLALAGTASAAIVSTNGATVIYAADPGAADAVTLALGGPGLLVTSSAGIAATGNCTNEGPHAARCLAATPASATWRTPPTSATAPRTASTAGRASIA
jgi:hypothetical protein